MRPIQLDARLGAVANFVRKDSVVADIGTDHAYLPVFLVQQNIAKKVIACDCNAGPLSRAAETVKAYRMENGIVLRLGDGLKAVFPGECDDVIIAGMGGELIADIIKAAPWVKDPRYRLILQPMTKAERLRKFLLESGFAVERETAVVDSDKIYNVLCSAYRGQVTFDETDIFFGGLRSDQSAAAAAYRQKVIDRLQKRMAGLQKAGKNTAALLALMRKLQTNGKEDAAK